MSDYHIPVLLQSCIDFLQLRSDGIYVDGTMGGGGHSEKMLESGARIISIDADSDAIRFAGGRLAQFGERSIRVQDNFSNLSDILERLSISKIDGLLLDLGVSSFQLDRSSKGFSYRFEAALSMNMSDTGNRNAGEILNTYAEENLSRIFWEYGEEKNSRRIAREIIKQRALKPIETTTEMVKIIGNIIPERYAKKTLSRIFQALRIEVNDEMNNLKRVLQDVTERINSHGRLVIISYHSLEDRIVKDFFKQESLDEIYDENIDIRTPKTPRLLRITKKPIEASEEEIQKNPRARSAKLRVAEKI